MYQFTKLYLKITPINVDTVNFFDDKALKRTASAFGLIVSKKSKQRFSVFALIGENVEAEEKRIMEKTRRTLDEAAREQMEEKKESEIKSGRGALLKLILSAKKFGKMTGVYREGLQQNFKLLEFYVAFSISIAIFFIAFDAFVLTVNKDYECGQILVAELENAGVNSSDAAFAAQLWYNARPRIVVVGMDGNDTDGRETTTNPFVPRLRCQFEQIESLVATSCCDLGCNNLCGKLGSLKTLPSSIGFWKKLRKIDLQNNQLETLPHSLFNGKHLNMLSTVLLAGNPVHDVMLDLSHQNMSSFPSRLCNLTSGEKKFGEPVWEWDLVEVQSLDLTNTSLTSLPIKLVECLPCLSTLKIGGNPILHPMKPNLFEVWETLIAARAARYVEVADSKSSVVKSCIGDYGESCSHQSWYGDDKSFEVRRYPSCECSGTSFILDVGEENAQQGNDDEYDENNLHSEGSVQVDWSSLLTPLSSRCTSSKSLECRGVGTNGSVQLKSLAWYFLDARCGAVQNLSITKMNLKCSGIQTLDLDTLVSMSSLVQLDLSDSLFDTEKFKFAEKRDAPFIPIGKTVVVSPIWDTISKLGRLKSFKMENTMLGNEHFEIASAMWLDWMLTERNLLDDFSVANSNVNTLEWSLHDFRSYADCLRDCSPTDRTDRVNVTYGKCCVFDPGWKIYECSKNSHEIGDSELFLFSLPFSFIFISLQLHYSFFVYSYTNFFSVFSIFSLEWKRK